MHSKWTAEIIFLLITVVLALLIVHPIHEHIGEKYQFYTYNYAFIIIFFTFSRYILLLRYTPFAYNLWVKLILLFACIPLFIVMIDGQYNFNQMLDQKGLEPIVNSDDLEFRWNMAKYGTYQYLFFSTTAIITLIMLPIRMIVSIWRVRNKGTI